MIFIKKIIYDKYGYVKLEINNENTVKNIIIKEKDLLNFNILKPQKLNINTYEKILKISEKNTIEYETTKFILRKQRSTDEVKKFISRYTENSEYIEKIIMKFLKNNYLNDKEYIEKLYIYYLENLYGINFIKIKLNKKFSENYVKKFLLQNYNEKIETLNLEKLFKKQINIKEYISEDDFYEKFRKLCIYKGYTIENINKFLINIDKNLIKINYDKINVLIDKYLKKIKMLKLNKWQKRNKVWNYLCSKKINKEKIKEIIDML